MNKEQIISLIENPDQTTTVDRQELTDLVRTWPFFQTAHLLLLQNLNKYDSPEFAKQLRESALFIADRKVLFNSLFGLAPLTNSTETSTTTLAVTDLLEIDENPGNLTLEENPENGKHSPGLHDPIPDTGFELETETELNNHSEELPHPSQFQLIEKFVVENPAFSVNKLDLTEEREDISTDSIKEPEELATEMLAIVYTGQKLYDKAITIYEKLILKFPEKSAYFGDRIEELRNKI
jgi:hypothetical protein